LKKTLKKFIKIMKNENCTGIEYNISPVTN